MLISSIIGKDKNGSPKNLSGILNHKEPKISFKILLNSKYQSMDSASFERFILFQISFQFYSLHNHINIRNIKLILFPKSISWIVEFDYHFEKEFFWCCLSQNIPCQYFTVFTQKITLPLEARKIFYIIQRYDIHIIFCENKIGL